MLRDFIQSVGFLTRIPVPLHGQTLRPILEASWCFPLVGLAIGAAAAAVLALAFAVGLPGTVSILVAVAATSLLTGALHEDGLADTCDGFGGGDDADRKIAIMRDSRIGTYGVLALILVTALKTAALASLLQPSDPLPAMIVLMTAHALGRGALVGVAAVLRPADSTGLGYHAGRPSTTVTLIASGLTVAIPILLLSLSSALLITFCATVAAAIVAIVADRQIGGYTGDVLGAVEQIVETTVLMTAAAILAHGLPS